MQFYRVITNDPDIQCRIHNAIYAAMDSYRSELFKKYGPTYHDKLESHNATIIQSDTYAGAEAATLHDTGNWHVVGPVRSNHTDNTNTYATPKPRRGRGRTAYRETI